ncbi:MAG: D-glycerate dehydrogenase [Balneolaceae bacterium]|nr:D-glycerate dehydrogenase [Balneolaceae bacterium]MBO6545958.1 D-glycerate dehydrogenase [Balneolaceae bacterium]MBO6647354.1 D-glycerate dehydrogenase [Balneolaceae bacterium]
MKNPRILITEPIPQTVISHLKEFGEVTVGEKGQYNSEEALIDVLKNYDALLCMLSTPVTKKVLRSAPNLKIVANFAVGYNNIDVKTATNLDIKVANTPDVLTEACGDFAMALLMATTRNFYQAETYLREGKFKGWEPLGFLGMELRGKTLGIVGMGRIGQAFAHRAKAFGMNISYHNRSRLPKQIEEELDCSFISTTEELARQSDVLSLNCPLTSETHHLVDKDILTTMPKHAILINISRGPVVDEEALAEALHNKEIAGAGLDVFEREPEVHPRLLSAPNCTMLPHIASATFETREAIGMLAAKAIIKVFNGVPDKEISNLVTG